ncbi:26S proteasome regulatory subunit, ATPase 3, interacting protein [Nematocida sp. LUAm3]|nr:26S proteasome regulatory subunit, ATPase 3, interacting protein [Nematocida sp. LUAm3]KAI5174105.1 26S proteasome regulatory subunit, ATPase 3, interacting protein [Nematocida sp. LUAm2]KAI5177152.1 26S proteasome regulatory subunit, ATPase 3, interacting protein [Nematocida sp. LUAm1]
MAPRKVRKTSNQQEQEFSSDSNTAQEQNESNEQNEEDESNSEEDRSFGADESIQEKKPKAPPKAKKQEKVDPKAKKQEKIDPKAKAIRTRNLKPAPTMDPQEQEEILLKCIVEKNRPLSVSEIETYFSGNGKIPLKTIRAALMSLAEKKLIKEKVGKTTRIYGPMQKKEDENYNGEAITEEIEELQKQINETKERNKALVEQIKGIEEEPSDGVLVQEIERLQEEAQEYKEKLSEFSQRVQNKGKLDPKEKEKLIKELEKMQKEKIKRKKIFNTIVSQVLEGADMSKSALFAEAGIE